jgi:hypothetical protein
MPLRNWFVHTLLGLSLSLFGFMTGFLIRYAYGRYQIYSYPGWPWSTAIIGLQGIIAGFVLGLIFFIFYRKKIRTRLNLLQHVYLFFGVLAAFFALIVSTAYLVNNFLPYPQGWR